MDSDKNETRREWPKNRLKMKKNMKKQKKTAKGKMQKKNPKKQKAPFFPLKFGKLGFLLIFLKNATDV